VQRYRCVQPTPATSVGDIERDLCISMNGRDPSGGVEKQKAQARAGRLETAMGRSRGTGKTCRKKRQRPMSLGLENPRKASPFELTVRAVNSTVRHGRKRIRAVPAGSRARTRGPCRGPSQREVLDREGGGPKAMNSARPASPERGSAQAGVHGAGDETGVRQRVDGSMWRGSACPRQKPSGSARPQREARAQKRGAW